MRRLQITRPGIVLPVRPDADGKFGPTPDQARGPYWRRSSRGLYVPASVNGAALEQRIVEAAAGTHERAAVSGWAALAWQGVDWLDGSGPDRAPLPIPLALGHQRSAKPRAGVVLCEDWLFDDDVVEYDGLPITAAARSVSYEVRRALSLLRAVQLIDMAAAADLVSLDELRIHAARIHGRPGTRMLRAALALADENVWSPQETTLRLEWRRPAHQGEPQLICNRPIFDLHGQHLFTPDVFDAEWAVAGEYNGAVHESDAVHRRDLDREELFARHHVQVVTMVNGDRRDPRRFHRRREAAYGRASKQPRKRTWTLTPPPWWLDTTTVAARRALSPADRQRWLARH